MRVRVHFEVAGVPFKLTSYIPYISLRCVGSFRRSLLKAGPMPFPGRKAAGHGREAPCKGDVMRAGAMVLHLPSGYLT